MISREAVYAALFALAQNMTWQTADGSYGEWAFTARRVYNFDRLEGRQPALCQSEDMETSAQKTNFPQRRVWRAKWIIFHQAGADENAIPAMTTNAILDAIDALFPTFSADNVFAAQAMQTLGGLVDRCGIEGQITKIQGDLTGQALIVVPLMIIAP